MPSHAEMVRKLDVLVDNSKSSHRRALCVYFSEYILLTCIEVPVMEFNIAILNDLDTQPTYERLTSSIFSNFRAVQLEGFRDLALGLALGDLLTNVYFAGWDSVKVCVSLA